MGVISGLCCFALKPMVEGACASMGLGFVGDDVGKASEEVIAGTVGRVADFLYSRFKDESLEILVVLRKANDQAWKSLEVALAGESFWSFLSDRTDKSFREQVRLFLDRVPLPESVRDQADFRKQCVLDIQKARGAGLLSGDVDPAALSRDVGAFARFSGPHALVEHRNKLAAGLAREIREGGFQSLGYLLAAVDMEESVLVHALRHFFNREVECRPKLQKFLQEMQWQHLQTSMTAGFDALADVLQRQDALLTKLLAEASALRAEAREHYLDLKEEFRRLDERQARAHRELYQSILQALKQGLRQPEREVRFSDSLSVRSDAEYQLVKQLIGQYRQLPEDQRRRQPALMNAVGKLEVLSGDLDAAQRSFQTVATLVPGREARAQAHYNAYQAALQRGEWAAALGDLLRAVELAPAAYAPFPLDRYHPKAILGAGGFGVAFLCRHRELESQVVVKALMTDQLDSSVDQVFREAQVLDQLDHPCVIRLRECGYGDPANKERPYFLLNYFEGGSLEQHVARHGPLSVADALQVGRLIAQGLQAAHGRGILHRDVKPANVLVRKAGTAWQVKLIDFGLAIKQQALRNTVRGAADPTNSVVGKSIAGTLDYAAPEQMGRRDEPVAAYSDVFGFGKTLCYALFQTPNPGPKHWLGLSHPRLLELLGSSIEEAPASRPQSFKDVLAKLEAPAVVKVVPPAGPAKAPPAKPAAPLELILLDEGPPRPERKTPRPRPPEPLNRNTPRPRPPEVPTVPKVADLRRDRAEYDATIRKYGIAGERLFLKQRAAQRQGDWKTAAEQGDAFGRFLLGLQLEQGVGVSRDFAAAAGHYRVAADAGFAPAQYNLAEMHALGEGVAADEAAALGWYRKAAEQGHAAAQFTLGLIHQAGRGVPADPVQAAEWYRKAAEQGHAAAQNNLARMFAEGLGVPRSDVQAARWYRKAAEQGHADAQNNLAAACAAGLGVEHDDAEAASWYRKAAEHGHTGAQLNLGVIYAEGRGVSRDVRAAAQWLRKAAEQGHAEAQCRLAQIYLEPRGMLKDEAQAMRWLQKAVEQNHPTAQYELGLVYALGKGLMRDDDEAVRYYRLAAEQGHAEAQNALGQMLQRGRGVVQDDGEAVRYYRLAAEQGLAEAQLNLGRMHQEGRGVARDDAAAVAWYRKAANQKLPEAVNGLGGMYAEGLGVSRDDAEAARCYRLAAEQGYAEAQYNLAGMYEQGRGVPKDLAKANTWYLRAARQGHEGARAKRPDWSSWVNRFLGSS
jgi:TPR repeat protein/serine/threonine protein kinase